MPLHLTKIAFGCDSMADLARKLKIHEEGGRVHLTTRYLPKRHAEMAGGSLYWILAHQLIGRSPLIGFEPAPDGRTHIVIEPRVIAVAGQPKRAHQGWRYLDGADAPPDLAGGAAAIHEMPREMLGELTRLGLV